MSTDTPNFQSILDDSPTEVERPQPLPVGTYLCTVASWRQDKSTKKGTPFIEFTLKPVAADEDVDTDALTEMGGFDGRQIRATYYITEDAVWRLDEFQEHCGVDLDDGNSRRMRLDQCINAQVLAYVKHEQSEDGSQTFMRLGRTAPAD